MARPGRESRHNLKYWRDAAWLGFGCGAHSTRGPLRWKNVAGTTEYVERLAAGRSVIVERQTRTPHEQLEDALFTGLRLVEGIDIGAGRLVFSDGTIRLTREGMLVANDVMTVFV